MALKPPTPAAAKAAVNEKAEKEAAEKLANEAQADAAAVKASEEKAAKEAARNDVQPGRYRAKQYKFVDPYTGLVFTPTRETEVARVTNYFAAQVTSGVLERTGDLSAQAPAETTAE